MVYNSILQVDWNAHLISDYLAISDYVALGSSLRIVSPVPVDIEVQVYKLEMASVLSEGFHADHPGEEYSAFFNAVVGNSNDSGKSKILALLATA